VIGSRSTRSSSRVTEAGAPGGIPGEAVAITNGAVGDRGHADVHPEEAGTRRGAGLSRGRELPRARHELSMSGRNHEGGWPGFGWGDVQCLPGVPEGVSRRPL